MTLLASGVCGEFIYFCAVWYYRCLNPVVAGDFGLIGRRGFRGFAFTASLFGLRKS